ncbi:hypothetical protein MRY88_13105 [Bacillus cereus]|uniref:hypothetical protein n=1 Tax=Bacillus TaxID=1386 RepID=UPI0002E3ABB8|nr:MULTISPECIES: hypothetical protein [Bacillus]AJG55079.1 putative group-specific protein [Bacillus cereus 03BB102]KAB7635239.1 hypothetical protein GBN83_24685 [Bacillus sp. B3-WWTP-C-10-D-3]MEC3854839.1 hypothetical protein [Bacillus sp. WOD8 KX774193]OFE39185.1 hypothetical protein BGV83_25900 [Bacillus anthracis]QPR83727.1 hypothetical protein I6G75_02925 [Bacillus cereus]
MLGGGSALKLMQAQFQYRDEDYNTLFNEFKAIMEKNHELKNDLYVCQCTCCRRTTAKKRAHRLEVTKSITSARYSAQGSFVLDGMKKLTKGVRKELHTRLAKLSNRNVDVVIIIAHPTRVLVLMNVKYARLVMNYVGWADIWIHSLKRIVDRE